MSRRTIVIVVGVLVALGLFLVFLFKSDIFNYKSKTFYSVSFVFIDEEGNRITDVKVFIKDKELEFTLSGNKVKLSNIEENSTLVFEIDGYDFKDGNTFVVKENVDSYRINLIKQPDLTIATAEIIVFDKNNTKIEGARIYYDEKLVGQTNNEGKLKFSTKEILKDLLIQHSYFDFDSINLNLEFGKSTTIEVHGNFNKERYLSNADVIEKGIQYTIATTTYNNATLKGTYFSYKLFENNSFTLVYDPKNYMIFETLYEYLFAYSYSEETQRWFSSNLLFTSPLTKNVVLSPAKMARITTSPYQIIYTSDGRHFSANSDGILQIVLPTFDGIKFYKNYNFETKEYSNEVLIVDKDGSEFTNYSDLNYNLYLVNK